MLNFIVVNVFDSINFELNILIFVDNFYLHFGNLDGGSRRFF